VKISLPFVGLALTLVVLTYLESPYSVINEKHTTISSIPYEVALAEAREPVSTDKETGAMEEDDAVESEEIAALNYSLKMILEEKSEIDNYVVETYREYEIYTDNDGQVVKKVPTSNYDYLRYRK